MSLHGQARPYIENDIVPHHAYPEAAIIRDLDAALTLAEKNLDTLIRAAQQCVDQSLENGHGIPPYGVWMYEVLNQLADRT